MGEPIIRTHFTRRSREPTDSGYRLNNNDILIVNASASMYLPPRRYGKESHEFLFFSLGLEQLN